MPRTSEMYKQLLFYDYDMINCIETTVAKETKMFKEHCILLLCNKKSLGEGEWDSDQLCISALKQWFQILLNLNLT